MGAAVGVKDGCGIRRVMRPATDHAPAFELAYVRSGPRTDKPIVVIPGGPGLASILPYRGFRRMASRGGLDVIMIEHRGIGFSRKDLTGRALPQSAMRVADVLDDIEHVLNSEGVEKAFIAGSSYGSYLAASFGARHPERVAGMVLDSALLSSGDLALERALIRELFWDSDGRIPEAVRRIARTTADPHRLLDVVRAAYELGGTALLSPLLELRLRRHWSVAWRILSSYSARDESITRVPGHYEFDIAGAIGFRELGYGAAPDGLPLDPALTYAPLADRFPPFAGELYDLPSAIAAFDWPMAFLIGSRDVRTPPEIARRAAVSARDAVQVEIDNGHSALETHPVALLNTIRELVAGRKDRLSALGTRLNRLPRRGYAARFPGWLGAILRIERGVRG